MIAGAGKKILGKDVTCIEEKCKSKGDPQCEFRLKSRLPRKPSSFKKYIKTRVSAFTLRMLLKPLGKSGLKISEIGQGTWAYRGGPEALRAGIACGMTHVDTAEMYGTEDAVGKAIADIRDEVFLASKVSPQHLHYNDVIRAAEGSLSRLNTTIIDLYMIHWPNRRIPIQETMRAMEDLVKQGKIRYIGVSNFSVEELKDAQEALSSYRK